MTWVLLSALCNVAASLLLKSTATGRLPQRFSEVGPTTAFRLGLCVAIYGLALVTYLQALRVLPMAIAYLSITALSAVAIAFAGWVIWGEVLDRLQIVFATMILAGLVGLHANS